MGAPFTTRGPTHSGSSAPISMAAQPPWQLPLTTGLPRVGWRSRTIRRNSVSARATSASVWPSMGSGKKITKYTGWPALRATPTCESSLNPPIPGPWPARGSMMTNGRLSGSIPMPERVPKQKRALDKIARVEREVTPDLDGSAWLSRIEPRAGGLAGGLDVVLQGRCTTALVDLREFRVGRWDLIREPGGLVFWDLRHRCLPDF